MGNRDFDLNGFIEDMKACKPPYKCPFGDCGKVYKSYSGIHQHLLSHAPGGSNAGSGARTPNIPSGRRSPAEAQPFYKSPQKDSLFYNEAEKMIEFESSEGSLQRLSIYDALEGKYQPCISNSVTKKIHFRLALEVSVNYCCEMSIISKM